MSNKAWSDEDSALLTKLYVEDNIKDPYELAEKFGKGYRSVISKLVQLKIYVKPEDVNKSNKPTVKELLRKLESLLDIRIESMNLSKKENLVMIVNAIENKLDEKT